MASSALPDDLSPDSIDVLTDLVVIINRLRPSPGPGAGPLSTPALAQLASLPSLAGGSSGHHTPNTGGNGIGGGGGGGGGGHGSSAAAAATASASNGGDIPAGGVTGTTPLPNAPPGAAGGFKDLPAATDGFKHKLQRARTAIRALPDMGRDLAAQEREIAMLEARRQAQLAELARLREEGVQFARAEQSRRDEGEGEGEEDILE